MVADMLRYAKTCPQLPDILSCRSRLHLLCYMWTRVIEQCGENESKVSSSTESLCSPVFLFIHPNHTNQNTTCRSIPIILSSSVFITTNILESRIHFYPSHVIPSTIDNLDSIVRFNSPSAGLKFVFLAHISPSTDNANMRGSLTTTND